tara:strand:+ start:53 stop:1342 length:1290 start_codon:yes stop_codon:yes gene_type:complete
MDKININNILGRDSLINEIKDCLTNISKNKNNIVCGRGIYIYGSSGSGKTYLANYILKEMGYDVIMYNAGDIRNKSIIESITLNTMSENNIISIFNNKTKPIAIIMDEIDGMKTGDKGGMNSLIKLIRPKKTKKQKLENSTINPIICIGSYYEDKKIRELMKVCSVFELKPPSMENTNVIVSKLMPHLTVDLQKNIAEFLEGDLRKLTLLFNIYNTENNMLTVEMVDKIFKKKSYSEDTKDSAKELLNNYITIDEHNIFMNETDRTIIGLLWHENIIDYIDKLPPQKQFPLYKYILKHLSYADNFDRIIFKKQIWQLSELSSIIKTFYSNYIFHEWNNKNNSFHKTVFNKKEFRFTKVLTKYSTEYNNMLFIQNLCQKFGLDKKDIITYFKQLREKYSDIEILEMHSYNDLTKLDLSRMYRYIDKFYEA